MIPFNNIKQLTIDVEQKINARNFDFNTLQLNLIRSNDTLLKEIIEILTNEYDVWETISDELLKVLNILLGNYDFSSDYYFNYNKYLIENNYLNLYIDSAFLDKEKISSLYNILRNKIRTSDYIANSSSASKEIIDIIVAENKVDLLSSINFINDISEEACNYFSQYFLENNLSVPPIFYNYLKRLNIPITSLDVNALIRIIKLNDIEIDENIYNLILEKLKFSNSIIINDSFWKYIFLKLNDDQRKQLSNILLEKNSYIETSAYLDITENNYEQYIYKFLELINLNMIDINTIEEFSNHNMQKIISDDRVIESLIKNKYLLIALCSPNIKRHLSLLIGEIMNNAEYYKEMNFSDYTIIYEHYELLETLVKIGNRSILETSVVPKDLVEYYKNNVLHGDFDLLSRDLINDDEFVNQMIMNGKLDIVLDRKNKLKRVNVFNFTDESINVIIDRCINDLEFALLFVSSDTMSVIKNEKLLLFFINANPSFIDLIVNRINHLEENNDLYSEDLFASVFSHYVKKHNFNAEHFLKLEELYGPQILRYLENENIKTIINYDDEKFNKIIAIFPKIEFTMVDAEKVYDALKQFEFTKTNLEVIEVFATINHSLMDNNLDYLKILEDLKIVVENNGDKEKFFNKFSKVYPNLTELAHNNFLLFLNFVIEKIRNGSLEEKNYYTEVLHFITDYYIAYKREKARDNYDMYNDLDLPYLLDEKDKIKQFIKNSALKIHKNLIILEMQEKGINEDLANDCIEYYAYDKKDFSPERKIEIQKYIKLMISIANKYIKLTGISPYIIDNLDDENLIRRKYYIETNKSDIYEILINLRLDILKDTLLNPENHELYESLLSYIHKYKIHVFPNNFKKFMSNPNIDIALESVDVSNFISYYSAIIDYERKRLDASGKKEEEINLGIISILKYAEAYSAISSIYSQILGVEDAKLIKTNPKPNVAIYQTQGNTRLDLAVKKTLKNFERLEVTIPTFNEVIKSDNGKELRVVVGNFTHSSNMTMGERTGSCMRIGGLGSSLFDFVLENKNGFNIRFEDPETHEFISRVSGFRNGNTVFLNELRNSCNPDKYSDNDIVCITKKVSELLIEQSKNSSYPIENVVIHNAYATLNQKLNVIFLGIDDSRIGLDKFYADIKDRGIVLATTKEPFVKIDFNKENIPIYLPAREKTYASNDTNRLRAMINRVHTIRYALANFNYEYIEPLSFDNGITYGIANQDWYIYLDEKGNIFEEVIDFDKRAIKELEVARETIMGLKSSAIKG